VNSLQQFRILTKDAGKAQTDVKITAPSGQPLMTNVIPTYEGCLVNFIPSEPGDYQISTLFAGELVPQATKKFKATPGSDPTKVRAFGPGLEGGVANKAAEFTIDTRGAGQGG
jgi:filamin